MSKPDSFSAPGSKRRGSSTHPSEKRKRLEENGIYMKASVLLKKESKKMCEDLLKGRQGPTLFPCYPASKLEDVLDRVHELNEARLQRDVMPWVVPSAENLHFSGAIDRDYIGEEVDTEWIRCETMGSSRPKPDFTAGLKRSAFSDEEDTKLQNYSTAQRPYLFTPDLVFPFLICEAKIGRIGLDNADTQNIHSASIATRAILSLYTSTFGMDHDYTKDLFGRILVFTVSHNNRVVSLYGHYAVPDGSIGKDSFKYFRHDIAMFSLTLYGGKERFRAYTFVKKVYEEFAPQHVARIRRAVLSMPSPTARTGLSFATSDVTLGEDGSQSRSEVTSQEHEVFKIPDEPASALQSRELVSMRAQLDRLLKQMEQQAMESRRREDAVKQQMGQQREEGKKREKALEHRLDQMMGLLQDQRDSQASGS
ncbi:hypothetical protein LTR78_009358 [Recurvomyces mirabilis]|uniref:DUF7924 domain-containing protein n=1 Tax=Recurvomyces mirabilis TaxID=574656 RepID=A0AAE0TTN5_9PEZI|nr:hypothetical protein LTR78_009358 [Recurvomyces mirabilis]